MNIETIMRILNHMNNNLQNVLRLHKKTNIFLFGYLLFGISMYVLRFSYNIYNNAVIYTYYSGLLIIFISLTISAFTPYLYEKDEVIHNILTFNDNNDSNILILSIIVGGIIGVIANINRICGNGMVSDKYISGVMIIIVLIMANLANHIGKILGIYELSNMGIICGFIIGYNTLK